MPRKGAKDSDRRNQKRTPLFRRRGMCMFCQEKKEPDYKEVEVLRRFMTDRGKLVGRNRSGLCQKHQRRMAVDALRARHLGLLPFVVQPRF